MQAQPGAAELAGRRAVGLHEGLEDTRVLVGGDADAGVFDGENEVGRAGDGD